VVWICFIGDTWKGFPTTDQLETFRIPALYFDIGSETWSSWICNESLYKGSFQQLDGAACIIHSKEPLREWEYLFRPYHVHHFARFRPKRWATVVCWVGCGSCWLPRASHGWRSKWNRDRDTENGRIKRWMGLLEESSFGHALALSARERVQDAQAR